MNFRPTVRPAILAGAVAAATLQLSASQAPQTRTPERGGEHLVVQFAAVQQDGAPVTDLKAEEVSIRVGGRTRQVRSLQSIPVDASRNDTALSGLPLPFGSNAVSAAGRTMVLLVDDESFRPGLETVLRSATDTLIADLGPGDRVSVVTLPLGGVRVPLTSEHARVRTAIGQIVGHASPSETGSDLACRTRRTLEALVTYLESLGVREESFTMVFVTAGLAAPRRDAVSALAPGMCELSEHLFTRVGIAAGAARAQFYVVRPGDAPDAGASLQRETARGSDNPLAGMEHLAGITGGKLLALTGASGTALERIVRETASYYLASVDAQASDRSGRTQQLDVKVSRRGVEVRSRPHITYAKPDAASERLANPSLRDMLGTQVVFRDLPLRAAGFPALSSDGQVRIVTVAEPGETGTKLESLAAVLFDPDGKVASQWLATEEELQRLPVMGAMNVPPGLYRLRVAAIDATGRSGTADYEVAAELVKTGPLTLSSLVVGLSRGGTFIPKLLFTNEPVALAYVELEGASAGAKVSAALEVSQTLNGPAIVSVPLTIGNTAENKYAAMGSIATGALPPGDYVVRAMIGLEGHAMTRVVRTIRKVK